MAKISPKFFYKPLQVEVLYYRKLGISMSIYNSKKNQTNSLLLKEYSDQISLTGTNLLGIFWPKNSYATFKVKEIL